jgi:CRISPR-associated protein Csx17
MAADIPLLGCTPTPLASYLKALAVLRLVAEAGTEGGGDPDAMGFWRNDVFVLRTRLTYDGLRNFFLERYRPTPLVAPWGARSGFYAGGAEKTAREALTDILRSDNDQLAPFRSAIKAVHNLLSTHGFDEKASDEKKLELLSLCRSSLPETLLPWLDACYVLTSDGRKFPPLLGTGGNEGSGSYVSGFAQQVVACVAKREHDEALSAALSGYSQHSVASDQMPGHFYPGAGGGPNASTGVSGPVHLNAWDYILGLEGTVLFAASAARRLDSVDPSIIVAPFTVRSRAGTTGGADSNDDVDARGEIWMPLWSTPFSIDELRCLLTEGRAALNGKRTRDGLDFARAVAQLGVDRGIDTFQRYGFLKRSGKAYLATPLNRVRVQRNPNADLINDLERRNWLTSVQRYARDETAPNAFRSAARQLDTALFALTQHSGPATLQNVLRHVGRIEAALSRSPKSRDAVRAPAPRLSKAWAIKAGGERASDSSEFRIALALAGLRIVDGNARSVLHARRHLARVSEPRNAEADREWDSTSSLAVWGPGPLIGNLGALLHRRRLEALKNKLEGEVLASSTGATCEDISEFLAGRTDDTRTSELLAGLACVDLHTADAPHSSRHAVLPPAFVLLKIFFTSEKLLHQLKLDWLPEEGTIRLPDEMPARLAADDLEAALKLAWQRLRSFGVKLPGRDPPRVIGADGRRWLAALCIPLTRDDTRRLIESLRLEAKEQRQSTESIS